MGGDHAAAVLLLEALAGAMALAPADRAAATLDALHAWLPAARSSLLSAAVREATGWALRGLFIVLEAAVAARASQVERGGAPSWDGGAISPAVSRAWGVFMALRGPVLVEDLCGAAGRVQYMSALADASVLAPSIVAADDAVALSLLLTARFRAAAGAAAVAPPGTHASDAASVELAAALRALGRCCCAVAMRSVGVDRVLIESGVFEVAVCALPHRA